MESIQKITSEGMVVDNPPNLQTSAKATMNDNTNSDLINIQSNNLSTNPNKDLKKPTLNSIQQKK